MRQMQHRSLKHRCRFKAPKPNFVWLVEGFSFAFSTLGIVWTSVLFSKITPVKVWFSMTIATHFSSFGNRLPARFDLYLLFWSVTLHWFTDAGHQEMEIHELFQWCWAVSFYEPSKVACKWKKRPDSCFAGRRRKLSATSVFNMLRPPFLNGNCYCSWRRAFKSFFAQPKQPTKTN